MYCVLCIIITLNEKMADAAPVTWTWICLAQLIDRAMFNASFSIRQPIAGHPGLCVILYLHIASCIIVA